MHPCDYPDAWLRQAIPCAIAAGIAHPGTHHNLIFRVSSTHLQGSVSLSAVAAFLLSVTLHQHPASAFNRDDGALDADPSFDQRHHLPLSLSCNLRPSSSGQQQPHLQLRTSHVAEARCMGWCVGPLVTASSYACGMADHVGGVRLHRGCVGVPAAAHDAERQGVTQLAFTSASQAGSPCLPVSAPLRPPNSLVVLCLHMVQVPAARSLEGWKWNQGPESWVPPQHRPVVAMEGCGGPQLTEHRPCWAVYHSKHWVLPGIMFACVSARMSSRSAPASRIWLTRAGLAPSCC